MVRQWLGVLAGVGLAACGSKSASEKTKQADPPTSPSQQATAEEHPAEIERAAAPAPPPPPVKLTKKQRREYRDALWRGRKLARAGKHEKAIAELETAIEINPAGSRAYSELGWALFKTADYTRANKITLAAVRLAIEPNVRAASLYNLGRIAEENGDVDAARDAYIRSLKLRANGTVTKRAAALGVEASAAFAPAPPCTEPSDKKTLCKCLLATLMDPQWLNEPECKPRGKKVDGLQAWEVRDHNTDYHAIAIHYLVEGEGDSLRTVAQLARAANVDYNLAESVKVASFTPRTVGDHTVYEINATLDSEEGFYTGIFDVKFTQTFRTLCVRGDAGVTCPFQVPIRAKFFATAFELDDPDHVEEFKETYGAAPPYRWSYAITVDISDGGAVTVKRKSGSASRTDLYVGKQQLW